MSQLIETTIAQSSLFQHLSPEAQAELCRHASVIEVPAGATIVEEGATVSRLYIVQRGVVRVSTSSFHKEVELKKLGAGAYFGEVSVLSGKTATATVEAFEHDVVLVGIEREAVLDLIKHDEKVRKVLEGVTLARAKDTIAKVLK